jgi:hypothetical protein
VSRARPAPGGDGRVGRWIRAVRGGETVIDPHRAKMPHQHAVLARYFLPARGRRLGPARRRGADLPAPGSPGLDDHVAFAWDDLDAWFEEDERPGWWRDYTACAESRSALGQRWPSLLA